MVPPDLPPWGASSPAPVAGRRRISSALRARRVLVLDGTAAHLGTHDTLLGSCTLYRDLVGYWHAET